MAVEEIRVLIHYPNSTDWSTYPAYGGYHKVVVTTEGYQMFLLSRADTCMNILKKLKQIDFNIISGVMEYRRKWALYELNIFANLIHSCTEIRKIEWELFSIMQSESVISATFTCAHRPLE